MKVQIMQVTPQLAEQFLMKNESNRKLMPVVVARYVREMLSGNWQETHQGIAFYEDGTLADGQHRLSAIVKAGITVNMVVTFGLTKPASLGMDEGVIRSVADKIAISGEKWATKDAMAMINLMFFYGKKKSASEIKKITNPEIISSIEIVCEAMGGRKLKGISSAPVMAALAMANLCGIDQKIIFEFSSVLKSGINREQGDISVILLRNTLLASQRKHGGTERERVMRLVQNALRAYIARIDLKMLKVPDDLIWSVKASQSTTA
jgi:hypothetical protein